MIGKSVWVSIIVLCSVTFYSIITLPVVLEVECFYTCVAGMEFSLMCLVCIDLCGRRMRLHLNMLQSKIYLLRVIFQYRCMKRECGQLSF